MQQSVRRLQPLLGGKLATPTRALVRLLAVRHGLTARRCIVVIVRLELALDLLAKLCLHALLEAQRLCLLRGDLDCDCRDAVLAVPPKQISVFFLQIKFVWSCVFRFGSSHGQGRAELISGVLVQ